MPCPHFDVKIIQRSKRQSAVASAAYQSGERLFSEYDQKQKYYSHKSEIVHTEIMLPPHAPPEYADRNTLWNAAEAIEKQWNSQLARRFVLAIPRELPRSQYADLIRDYCREFFVSKGMIADFAIHDKGDGNPHAHILLTMRAMDETGKWLPKSRKVYDLDENGERIRLASGRWKSHKEDTVDWNDQKYAEIWRQGWADTANRYDLRKLDDDNVYRKLQGHWIIEMSEMIATANAKSIEEIKSFLSRQKEVYKIPYETHPEDRLRQCVFGGTSNALDFLPLDRSGNRRFLPVMVYPERAEVHILDDEAASRAYIEQVWAEAMTTYKSGDFKLSFTPEMIQYLKEHQRDFMPEDTKAGMIQAYLDRYTGSAVCSKQLFKEALNHPFDEPKQWEIREVNDIMNHGITGWKYFSNPRIFEGYGRQKGWEREAPATGADNGREKTPDGFVEVTEQMELPF